MDKFHLCPRFEAAFQILGKRWTGLIIRSLLSGSKRFSELQDIIPALSSRVLTERFKELEELGIVTRSVYPEMPVRIEYGLTEKGKDLEKTMDEIQKWAEKWPDK
ncbi:winged helix-turn-helix transcriptional regulator [Clostridium estertheticum]|uniref:winged helix-turn-helix transcriptional regulator n=1 Tax=Clostridium estertheticum TaxID=238834 RepID=UPI001C7CD329|nr:helix-turn-helix domain-containing protein [Clostridium estertheticum]MBX4264598.1 helix-turn-helix transcriptional regulator [Clostridium estertheticum]MBX4268350.1 helix-turn-helix transcriptional regulator [Clostridium estertheticum]WLC81583.1 helix-turn-helix transcriptional regulator [Clostridium estertheticum]WLC88736.1 helix-turn-helix transcriptional regulator [Clostridium estertheticum]